MTLPWSSSRHIGKLHVHGVRICDLPDCSQTVERLINKQFFPISTSLAFRRVWQRGSIAVMTWFHMHRAGAIRITCDDTIIGVGNSIAHDICDCRTGKAVAEWSMRPRFLNHLVLK